MCVVPVFTSFFHPERWKAALAHLSRPSSPNQMFPNLFWGVCGEADSVRLRRCCCLWRLYRGFFGPWTSSSGGQGVPLRRTRNRQKTPTKDQTALRQLPDSSRQLSDSSQIALRQLQTALRQLPNSSQTAPRQVLPEGSRSSLCTPPFVDPPNRWILEGFDHDLGSLS